MTDAGSSKGRDAGIAAGSIPIVISSYNRPNSLARILGSLLRAHYAHADVPLFISLDAGGPNGTREIAEAFEWPFGPKTVLARDRQLGMRDHAFACMDLLNETKHIIFLEDDSIVGHNYYDYAVEVARHMDCTDEIFAASLYAFDFCEFDGLRFAPVATGEDLFLMKSATTWAVLFTLGRWREFREWHSKFSKTNEGAKYIPHQVNNWPKTSWKKFINRYLSSENKYFLYPYVSQITHFADPGTHFDISSGNFQVPTMHSLSSKPLMLRCRLDNMVRYDEFWELEPPTDLVRHVGCDFECDLRRIKAPDQIRKNAIVTSRSASQSRRDYSNLLFPLELNCWNGLDGDILHLVHLGTDNFLEAANADVKAEDVRYYMKDIGFRREIMLVLDRISKKIGR